MLAITAALTYADAVGREPRSASSRPGLRVVYGACHKCAALSFDNPRTDLGHSPCRLAVESAVLRKAACGPDQGARFREPFKVAYRRNLWGRFWGDAPRYLGPPTCPPLGAAGSAPSVSLPAAAYARSCTTSRLRCSSLRLNVCTAAASAASRLGACTSPRTWHAFKWSTRAMYAAGR